MNNETLPTTHLGRELPKDYINCIENGERFLFLTNTDYQQVKFFNIPF